MTLTYAVKRGTSGPEADYTNAIYNFTIDIEGKSKTDSIKLKESSEFTTFASQGSSVQSFWTAWLKEWDFTTEFERKIPDNNQLRFGWYAILHESVAMYKSELFGANQSTQRHVFAAAANSTPWVRKFPNILGWSGYGASGVASLVFDRNGCRAGDEILIWTPKGCKFKIEVLGAFTAIPVPTNQAANTEILAF